MYQPYPSRGRMPGQAPRPEPPGSVRLAVQLMYAGASVTALSLLAALLTVGDVRSALHTARPGLTPAELHTAVVTYVVAGVISDAIAIGLWIWMALANRAGKSWARIGATALLGIDTILLAVGVGRGASLVSTLVSFVIWVVGLAAVALLWRRQSSEFFASASAKGG